MPSCENDGAPAASARTLEGCITGRETISENMGCARHRSSHCSWASQALHAAVGSRVRSIKEISKAGMTRARNRVAALRLCAASYAGPLAAGCACGSCDACLKACAQVAFG